MQHPTTVARLRIYVQKDKIEHGKMTTNLDKYKADLDNLIEQGNQLYSMLLAECSDDNFQEHRSQIKEQEQQSNLANKTHRFTASYQGWYSESRVLIKQLLPDRLDNFVRYYEKPKTGRKVTTYENYTIEDYLTRFVNNIGKYGQLTISLFTQQLGILKSVKQRFESNLFDIKQMAQSDLFNSEIEAAKELAKKGFLRGAGAIAGVVLEAHLSQICEKRDIKINKKSPSISDYNEKLKEAEVYETPTWRQIQYLTDLRNLCDHKKEQDPKSDEVTELIKGVDKITKTVF